MLSIADCTLRRLNAVSSVIRNLSVSDFPYPHSEQALKRLEQLFGSLRSDVEIAMRSPDQDVVNNICTRALEETFDFFPLLGFVLRSTNVRTAFEIHGPLLRLARKLLLQDVKLLVSSEWEYSPYTYKPMRDLDEFVFIGLPATDSSNPLVFPLAGHELGHSIWHQGSLATLIELPLTHLIEKEITTKRWKELKQHFPGTSNRPEDFGNTLFDRQAIIASTVWATNQAEETFCDFVGLRVFGSAYLHAMSYILSPGMTGRPMYYPGLQTRFKNLMSAADSYGFVVPEGFEDAVPTLDTPRDWGAHIRFQVSLADQALEGVVQQLIAVARDIVTSAGVEPPDPDTIEEIADDFTKRGVPAHGEKTLADILNACWCSLMRLLDNDAPALSGVTCREACLMELVLKSIEILEVEARIASERERHR